MDNQTTDPQTIQPIDSSSQSYDGAIVEAETNQPETSELKEMTQAGMVLELEQLIKNHISGITTRRGELKKFKEMVADAFKNDATYQEVEEAFKKATKVKKDIKANILRQPGVVEAAQKVNELSSEIKELDGALSDYLREYQRLAGVNEIEDNEGNVHEIVYLAKLLKKGSKR